MNDGGKELMMQFFSPTQHRFIGIELHSEELDNAGPIMLEFSMCANLKCTSYPFKIFGISINVFPISEQHLCIC